MSLCSVESVHALNYNWLGGNQGDPTTWSEFLNWQSFVLPPTDGTAIITFTSQVKSNGSIASPLMNDLGNPLLLDSIAFSGTSLANVLGGAPFSLKGTAGIKNISRSSQTFLNDILVASSQTFTSAPSSAPPNNASANLLIGGYVNSSSTWTTTATTTIASAQTLFGSTTTSNQIMLGNVANNGTIEVLAPSASTQGLGIFIFGSYTGASDTIRVDNIVAAGQMATQQNNEATVHFANGVANSISTLSMSSAGNLVVQNAGTSVAVTNKFIWDGSTTLSPQITVRSGGKFIFGAGTQLLGPNSSTYAGGNFKFIGDGSANNVIEFAGSAPDATHPTGAGFNSSGLIADATHTYTLTFSDVTWITHHSANLPVQTGSGGAAINFSASGAAPIGWLVQTNSQATNAATSVTVQSSMTLTTDADLVLNGALNLGSGGVTLTKSGAGMLTIAGAISASSAAGASSVNSWLMSAGNVFVSGNAALFWPDIVHVAAGSLTVSRQGSVVMNTGTSLQIDLNASALLGGANDPLTSTSTPSQHIAVINDGSLNITDHTVVAASVSGAGTLVVSAGANFRSAFVRQAGVTINPTASGNSTLAIAAHSIDPVLRLTSGAATVNVVNSLSIGGPAAAPVGQLDLADNDLIIQSSSSNSSTVKANITALIKSGKNGTNANGQANWTGNGIISSYAAAQNVSKGFDLFTLAVVRNGDFSAVSRNPFSNFDNQAVTNDSILIKYTYNGDVTLDGVVDANDYFVIDKSFVHAFDVGLGYVAGDLNGDGVIDANDYFFIDKAFVNEAGTLAGSEIVSHAQVFGASYLSRFTTDELQSAGLSTASVPEPTSLALLTFGACATLRKRRK